jgi:PAS domain S-box-containing protein
MAFSEKTDPPDVPNAAWFQSLLETIPHVAFLLGPTGSTGYCNQRFTDYLGFRPRDGIVARSGIYHADDLTALEAALAGAAASGTEYVVEARLRRHDGAYRWHRIHNKPLFRDKTCIGWVGTAVDIDDVRQINDILEQRVNERTAQLEQANQRLRAEAEQRQRIEAGLRLSEQRFRTMYNRTPMALQSVNADARLLDVNDTWTEMFGYGREEVIGRPPTDFMTAESAEVYRKQAWPEMLKSRGQVRTVDYQFRTRDGRIFDGRLSARGEFDAEGRFVRSWSAIADITAEKRADRELRRSQRMEAVGQLTGGIAHAFNNLLTAILGNLELLNKQPLSNDARTERLLSGARSAAERGARLTAQLLAFSRQQRVEAKPVSLRLLIQAMLPLLRGTVGGGIDIDFTSAEHLWPALADPAQLELAVLNLATNARDSMTGGGSIKITTTNVTRGPPTQPEEPPPGDYVALCVTDTGSGMPDAVREKIFEPFFTTKEIGKGSGLGLPHVLGVLMQLDGGIAVRSAPGQGTSVTVFLPRAEPAETAAHEAMAAAEAEAAPADRILLVDDDPDVRTIAADMLRDAGYDVIDVESGAAALAVLADGGGSAVAMVVDVAMPAMTGVELAAIVRKSKPALPIIFMTGYAAANILSADQARDVLHKPFQAAELEARVARAIGR